MGIEVRLHRYLERVAGVSQGPVSGTEIPRCKVIGTSSASRLPGAPECRHALPCRKLGRTPCGVLPPAT